MRGARTSKDTSSKLESQIWWLRQSFRSTLRFSTKWSFPYYKCSVFWQKQIPIFFRSTSFVTEEPGSLLTSTAPIRTPNRNASENSGPSNPAIVWPPKVSLNGSWPGDWSSRKETKQKRRRSWPFSRRWRKKKETEPFNLNFCVFLNQIDVIYSGYSIKGRSLIE